MAGRYGQAKYARAEKMRMFRDGRVNQATPMIRVSYSALEMKESQVKGWMDPHS